MIQNFEMFRDILVCGVYFKDLFYLLVVSCSLTPSDAIAKTFGSVMEKYHNTRFFKPGPPNNDIRLQRERFIRLNELKLGSMNPS